MSKCDHPDCGKEAKWYGWQQYYLVCDDHVKWGEKIIEGVMEEHEEFIRENQ